MAQAGFTPIQLYRTTTASAQPSAGNLAAGELAINLTDKKLYAKDASNNVFLLADASSGGTTAANLAGGATGSLPYQTGANATTFLGIGTAGQVLQVNSGATAPQWVNSSGTGDVARTTSPSFTTPSLGVATATSINKIAFTAPATAATLTIADGKTLAANSSLTLSGVDGKSLTINNSLVFAGTDATTMTFPSTSASLARTDAAQTFTGTQTFAPAANTSGIVSSSYSLTGSNAQSLVDLSGTWNTTGAPTGIKLNVTDTASNAASLLMDLQRGGVTQFAVQKDAGGYVIDGAYGLRRATNVAVTITGGLTGGAPVDLNGTFVSLNRLVLDRSNQDVQLWRDAANTLAQRNATNAQTFRLYNTFTDASNYERTAITTAEFGGVRYQQILAESAGTGSANLGIVLSPRGTGALSVQMPDGTATGGNARGTNAVDLQMVRGAATQVASGVSSFAAGERNTASAARSVALGFGCNATGGQSFAVNNSCSATASNAFAANESSIASAQAGFAANVGANAAAYGASALGHYSNADKRGQLAVGAGQFGSAGDAQWSVIGLRGSTTNNTVTEIFVVGTANQRAVVPASTTWMADVNVIARSQGGTDNACFKRRCIIKRDGANNTALVGTVQTIDTDIGSNAGAPPAGWAVTITADDTNESLKVEVTGATATNIRWVAKVDLVEVGYTA